MIGVLKTLSYDSIKQHYVGIRQVRPWEKAYILNSRAHLRQPTASI